MSSQQNWSAALAVFVLAIFCVLGWTTAISQTIKLRQVERPPQLPPGARSWSCDGFSVIVGKNWTAYPVPISTGKGDTYRIELIAGKVGYEDLQTKGFAFYKEPQEVPDEE